MKLDIELPPRIAALPRDDKGRPIPWFVHQEPGQPVDFRVMDASKFRLALTKHLCWVCGQKLGAYLTFVAGPMCGINRTSAEPPNHLSCAQFSATACPFLSTPRMHRREGNYPLEATGGGMGGEAILRNPGVTLLWTTKKFKPVQDGGGGLVLRMGEPVGLEFYCEGRVARREELDESVRTGLPILAKIAEEEGTPALMALGKMVREFDSLVNCFFKNETH